MDTIYRTTEAL